MRPLIIGAPFGNYSFFRTPNSTPTLGTFTLRRRGGVLYRAWRIARTLRYSSAMGGWVNKLGLPNPGIDSLSSNYEEHGYDKIISLAITQPGEDGLDELRQLLQRAGKYIPEAFEYNVSCPNIDASKPSIDKQAAILATWKLPARVKLIIKMPPLGFKPAMYAFADFADYYHCCNTLPCPGGGLSGPVLKGLVLQALDTAQRIAPDVKLIAGGGVRTPEDAMTYWRAGARHIAIASLQLNPFNWRLVRELDTWAAEMQQASNDHPTHPGACPVEQANG